MHQTAPQALQLISTTSHEQKLVMASERIAYIGENAQEYWNLCNASCDYKSMRCCVCGKKQWAQYPYKHWRTNRPRLCACIHRQPDLENDIGRCRNCRKA